MDLQLFLPVIMMSVLLTPGFSIITNESALQQLLENALTDNPHNLDELKGKFPTENLSPVTCVPVQYTIRCGSQCYNDSDTVSDFNCTSPSGYTASFLWTVFSTTKFPGNMLIFWLIGGVRVLGFDWDDSCKFHLNTDSTVMLLLPDITFPCISDPEGATEKALESITLRLKSYTEHGDENEGNSSYSQYSISGNTRRWQRNDIKTHQRGTVGVRIGLAVFCVLFTVLFAPKLLSEIHKRIEQKHFFWSFQILAFVWSWIGLQVTGFIGALKEDISIYVPIFYGLNGVYLVLAVITQCCMRNCNVKSCKKWFKLSIITHPNPYLEAISNIFVLQSTICLLTYLLYSLPSIALSYYAFPSRTLIRLSYFEFALIILFVAVALCLYVLEDCCKQWCCKQCCNKASEKGITVAATNASSALPNDSARNSSEGPESIPLLPTKFNDSDRSEYESLTDEQSEQSPQDQETQTPDTSWCTCKCYTCPKVITVSLTNEQSEQSPQDQETQTPDTSCNCCTCKCCTCEKFWTILKVITAILFLAISSTVLAVAGGIVFIATSNESETDFDDYLIIIPTILATVIVYLTKWTNFKIPETLDKEQKQAGKRFKDLFENRSKKERT